MSRFRSASLGLGLMGSLMLTSCAKDSNDNGINDITGAKLVQYLVESTGPALLRVTYRGRLDTDFTNSEFGDPNKFEETTRIKRGKEAIIYAKQDDSTGSLHLQIRLGGQVISDSTWSCPLNCPSRDGNSLRIFTPK